MRTVFATLIVLAAPRLALACPVCFGQSDSPLAQAANMGVFFMLGLTGVVLGAFGSFFIYLMRRAKFAAQAEQIVADNGREAGAQEGMA